MSGLAVLVRWILQLRIHLGACSVAIAPVAYRLRQSIRAFVPLTFALGEAFQFEWREKNLLIGGVFRHIQVFQMKLWVGRPFWLVAYPNKCHPRACEKPFIASSSSSLGLKFRSIRKHSEISRRLF